MALADYIDNKPTIDTLRLRIRPMCKADVPALMEWMPDKTIYKYWGKGPGKMVSTWCDYYIYGMLSDDLK